MDNIVRTRTRVIQGMFALLAMLFFVCIIIQVLLAGAGLFVEYSMWETHSTFIHVFEFIPLLLLILSFFGSMPKWLRWQSAGLYIMIVLQYITVTFADSLPYLAVLHPVIALILFWRSLVTVMTAVKLVRA
ncbi:hypothetical protein SAMN05421743_101279 [Thalassobacillus cyri]|uniref:Uncharacterized protein n=1 Tax=Thalassobacillus cyri TaxID=571932 RepID=A0A1H3W174_9BACI|nr:DUF6220 domain-containing protein [Thalassobacillus cyri]SDZ80813.1 hypothetical protein SAMN05421743_101279 [Thalassobacillus cyri]